MVQQPVIQLVQELTMTAVVEQHDCTGRKGEKKVPGPVGISVKAFLEIPLH